MYQHFIVSSMSILLQWVKEVKFLGERVNVDAYLSDGGLFYLNRVWMRPSNRLDVLLRHITYIHRRPRDRAHLSINYIWKYFRPRYKVAELREGFFCLLCKWKYVIWISNIDLDKRSFKKNIFRYFDKMLKIIFFNWNKTKV